MMKGIAVMIVLSGQCYFFFVYISKLHMYFGVNPCLGGTAFKN